MRSLEVSSSKRESRMVGAWGWERGGEWVFDGDRASVSEDEEVLGMHGGDGWTTL